MVDQRAYPTSGGRPSGVRHRRRGLLAGLVGFTLALTAPATGAVAAPWADVRGAAAWVGTWASVPTEVPPSAVTTLADQTVRQVVHASIGGDQVRVRLTNEFGDRPLRVGEAHVALKASDGGVTDIDPDTDRTLTFGGAESVTIPAGAPAISDPVDLDLPAGGDLVISLHLPESTPVTTVHGFSFQDNVVAAGNVTAAESVTATSTMTQWYFLSGVSVRTTAPAAASIVALGDSITDGSETERNANHRWPDLLAQRLRDAQGAPQRGVLNLGVAGNRLLHDPNPPAGSDAEGFAALFGPSALSRFDRDVVAQPGVGYVIVLLGVNDLGHPGTVAPVSETVSAAEIIDAHRQLIARAHLAGLKIYGATILPFADDTLGFFSEENEAKRQEINEWIRTGGEFDAVIDFDAAVRDAENPLKLRADFDSGDGLHPNDTGMAAMAEAIPLDLLTAHDQPAH